MRKRALLTVAVLAVFPATLRAQGAEERIEAARMQAESAGIPVSLLETKIAEGQAKGVPMERIAAVVEHRAAVLTRAQAAMAGAGAELTAGDLSAGADALDSGIDETVLRSISEAAPRESRAVAITALSELVAMGNVPEEALRRVTEALQHGPEALANLPAEAARARRGPPAGVGNRPADVGRGGAGVGPGGSPRPGPPPGVPTPGGRPENPGSGRPDDAGRPGGH